MPKPTANINILAEVRLALEIEAAALQWLTNRLTEAVESAIELLCECKGKVVVTGIGKSGYIGRKIAATLASTGTPAFFLHPGEAIHGDLGMLSKGDIVLALSNSGSTEEIVRLLSPLRRMGIPVIAMTGNPQSELAKRAEVHLDVSVEREACPLNLAPTASTTAALAMGDAIAVTLLRLRDFREEDFAVFHPGGNLGKKLVTTVADLMDSGAKLPLVHDSLPVEHVIAEILAKRYGITSVVDETGKLTGAFSLGDLLRLHIQDRSLEFMHQPVRDYMTSRPKSVSLDTLAAQALHVMESHNIRAIFVTDEEQRPVGIIGIYEVLKAIDY
ncbi:MAG: KpsF/GutQ family sugar-phosphate isomerase [Candidatus Competibacteraceae bacterium]|nr:KpsF/GutQ family sugar-phosphate isomerase [Candidatus Competibacteraceae bacterium]